MDSIRVSAVTCDVPGREGMIKVEVLDMDFFDDADITVLLRVTAAAGQSIEGKHAHLPISDIAPLTMPATISRSYIHRDAALQ